MQYAKRGTTVALTVAAVLLFASTALFAALFLAENSHHRLAVEQLDARKKELAALTAEQTSSEPNLRAVEALLDENGKLSRCVDAVRVFLGPRGDDAQRRETINQMIDRCQ